MEAKAGTGITSEAAELWISAYAEAWRDADPDAVVRLFTEGAIYRSHPFRPPHTGSKAVHDYWRQATRTQRNLDLHLGEPVVSGSRVAVEWWAAMTEEDGDLTLPGSLILRFAPDGRCEELREYWHTESGRHEPPEGWGV